MKRHTYEFLISILLMFTVLSLSVFAERYSAKNVVIAAENIDVDLKLDDDVTEPETASDDTYTAPEDGLLSDVISDAEPSDAVDDNVTKIYLISTADTVNVRSAPSTSSKVLGTVDSGDGLPLYGKTGEWYQTKYRKQTAYVHSAYFKKTEFNVGSDTAESVIEIAESLLGTPYIYGATRLHDGNGNFYSGFDSARFDCSSFTQYAYYYGAGICLGLTTRDQVKQGVHVDKSDLKRGDLIFFTNSSRRNNTGIERVGHVAIYLGNGYLLHTASDHAVIEPMTQSRLDNYIEARRMIS